MASPSPNDVDFDALSRLVNATQATEYLNELYGQAFMLPAWHFVARGDLPDVQPYIASTPGIADGRPMVRAFTGGERMARFAMENGLVGEDGELPSLSMPRPGAVDYLEGLTQEGIYGVWFNSDTASDGFFVPLQQLRPIREHMGRIGNWVSPARREGSGPPPLPPH